VDSRVKEVLGYFVVETRGDDYAHGVDLVKKLFVIRMDGYVVFTAHFLDGLPVRVADTNDIYPGPCLKGIVYLDVQCPEMTCSYYTYAKFSHEYWILDGLRSLNFTPGRL